MAEEFHEILTLDNLTEYLKTPKSTLYRLAQSGKLPGRKVGREWRFVKAAIDQWLQKSEIDDKSPNTLSKTDSESSIKDINSKE